MTAAEFRGTEMSDAPKQPSIKRRQFLAGAAAAAPALAAASLSPAAAQTQAAAARPSVPATPVVARDQQTPGQLPKLPAGHRCGADYMVDVLKGLDIEYVASCPGS